MTASFIIGRHTSTQISAAQALALNAGDTAVPEIHDGEVQLSTRKKQLENARALFQKYTPPGTQPHLVQDFLDGRRSKVAHDKPA